MNEAARFLDEHPPRGKRADHSDGVRI